MPEWIRVHHLLELCVTTFEKWVLSRWRKCRKVLCNNRCYLHCLNYEVVTWWPLAVKSNICSTCSQNKVQSVQICLCLSWRIAEFSSDNGHLSRKIGSKYISDQNSFMWFSPAALSTAILICTESGHTNTFPCNCGRGSNADNLKWSAYCCKHCDVLFSVASQV